jgi:hydrogenase 3 maturation protease
MKILAVGNELRGDDAIALEIAEGVGAIKAYEIPENFISEGDSVILIDAVDFGGNPGQVKQIKEDEILEQLSISTHNPSISIIRKLTKELFVIGIQPYSLNYEKGISEVLKSRKGDIISSVKLIIQHILNSK